MEAPKLKLAIVGHSFVRRMTNACMDLYTLRLMKLRTLLQCTSRRLHGFVHITAHEITSISTVHQHRHLHGFVHVMAHEITNISTGYVHITFHEIMTISTVHQHRCLQQFVLITAHKITNISTAYLHRETFGHCLFMKL